MPLRKEALIVTRRKPVPSSQPGHTVLYSDSSGDRTGVYLQAATTVSALRTLLISPRAMFVQFEVKRHFRILTQLGWLRMSLLPAFRRQR